MNYKKIQRKVMLISAGMVVCLLADPMQAAAAELNNSAKNVLQMAGASTLIDSQLSQDEYIAIAQQAQGASWGYTNLGIANVESGNLNIRETPSTEAKLVGKLPKNAACEVISSQDGWAHVKSGEVEGYVNVEFLLTGPDARLLAKELVKTIVRINVDGLNVRDQADISSAVLTQVPKGEELEYVETLGEWVKVSIDGEEGFVSAEFSTVEEKLDTAVTLSELLYGQGVSNVRVDLVEYAKQFVGNPYVWGGTSLTKGADCSGFTLAVYKKYGISLSHSSRAQANEGTKIAVSDIRPGDLLFYANSSGTINHVALYIGGNQVVHASSPKTGIKISKYNYRTPVKAVRILQD